MLIDLRLPKVVPAQNDADGDGDGDGNEGNDEPTTAVPQQAHAHRDQISRSGDSPSL